MSVKSQGVHVPFNLRRAELTRVPLFRGELPPVNTYGAVPPGRWVDIETGVGPSTVHLRDTPGPFPSAEVAVYLHGLAGSSTNWTDLAGVLSPYLRSVAVDLPGFGMSAPPDGFDYTRTAHADVVIGLLDALAVGGVHLFGNSFGGAVAIEIAGRRPDLVSSLTLISPAMPDLRIDLRRVSDRRMVLIPIPFVGPLMRRQLAHVDSRERAERLIRLCFAHPEDIPDHRVDEAAVELHEQSELPWSLPALGQTTRALVWSWIVPPSRSLWRLLPQIEAPTLVVWGSDDRLVSVRKGPRTALLIPRGRLLVLPRTGHVAQMESPRFLARAALGMIVAERMGSW